MAFFGGGGGPKSRSLDDIAAAAGGEAGEATKNKKPCLKDAGRANTYEDREELNKFCLDSQYAVYTNTTHHGLNI